MSRGSWYARRGKRWLDIGLSLTALQLAAPLLPGLALAVRIAHGRPVLFRQQRPGLGGRAFTIYKFRTMTDERGPDGELLPPEERVTRFGAFLRASSLDELPELLNVLKGDMSLVGPRPLLMEYLGRYSAEQMRRHDVLPGITGWAQVNGRNVISWQTKFEHDVYYVDHVSLGLDLRILAKTLWTVVRASDVNQQGYVSAEVFMGDDAPPDAAERRGRGGIE